MRIYLKNVILIRFETTDPWAWPFLKKSPRQQQEKQEQQRRVAIRIHFLVQKLRAVTACLWSHLMHDIFTSVRVRRRQCIQYNTKSPSHHWYVTETMSCCAIKRRRRAASQRIIVFSSSPGMKVTKRNCRSSTWRYIASYNRS